MCTNHNNVLECAKADAKFLKYSKTSNTVNWRETSDKSMDVKWNKVLLLLYNSKNNGCFTLINDFTILTYLNTIMSTLVPLKTSLSLMHIENIWLLNLHL